MSTLIFHKLIKGLIFQYVLALYFFSQIVKNFTDHNCKHRPTDMPSLNILAPTAVGKTCISCEAKDSTAKIIFESCRDILRTKYCSTHKSAEYVCANCFAKPIHELNISCERRTQESSVHLIRMMQALRSEVHRSKSVASI